MDASVAELARWWSWRRQRLDRSCRGVEDCLRSVVGVSSVNPHGPLALLARVPRLLKGGAVEGVITTKRAVRVPAMRRAPFLVPTDTAHLAFSATRDTSAAAQRALQRAGVDATAFAFLSRRIGETARAPMSAAEIAEAIPRAPERFDVVLNALCLTGDLLRIRSEDIRSNDFTYVATDAWLGAPLRAVDHAEALVWLAGDYLSAFGPATVDDFAWWTGAARDAAADAIAAHDPVDIGGGAFMHARDARAFEYTRPTLGRVNLLPKIDCYTMGYASDGRERFASRDLAPHCYDSSGDALPVVLVEGSVQGLWEFRMTGDRIRIKMSMFERPGTRLQEALDAEAELVGSFLEADRVVVEQTDAPRPARTRAKAAKSGGSTRTIASPAKRPKR